MIEALIGHMKVAGLTDRNWVKGTARDAMRAICATAAASCGCCYERPQLFYAFIADALGVAPIALLAPTAPGA